MSQLGGVQQKSTADAGVYLTHLVRAGWAKQCHTSVIAFDIAQFFSSLNHTFLSSYLKKAGLNDQITNFFNSYHANWSTTYSWNNFLSLSFPTNIGVGQGLALSPILSAIYLSPILKTYQKCLKNTNKEIPTNILSYINNGLIISQEKSFECSLSFLIDSYSVISNLLKDSGLAIEHQKLEVFHFSRAHSTPNHSINLTSAGGPVLYSKPIL